MNIQNIIKAGEGETVEFKSSFNDAVKVFSVGTETIQKWQNEIKIKTQPSIIPDINFVYYKNHEIVECLAMI